jgi:tRNA pseudouridine13 synthase
VPRLPTAPEDFRVDEIPLYPTAGRGEHTFLQVRKRGRTTEEVARDLARAAGVRSGDVGYAGRKDRNAITTQWFSAPGLDPLRALGLRLPGAEVVAAARHPHKLRTGHLRGNAFRIVVHDVSDAAFREARRRLEELAARGVPNRFGAQRFGRDGANAERAAALLAGGPAPRDRRHARFLVSALQAQVFNATLEARTTALDAFERGDVAVVHASGGLFVVEDPEAERERLRAFELSPTGPIFGTRTLAPRHAVAEREERIRAVHGVPAPLRPPRGLRLRGARRPLRVKPEAVALERAGEAALLRFTLPSGSYATVLLEELFDPLG